jgi:signal transduction histidine kinase
VQEAVTNAIKHADAKTIHIVSSQQGDLWQLTIRDDGKSFEPGLLQQDEPGNGLNNMKQRAADGNFGFVIHTGQGTSIIISINGHEEIQL